MMIPSRQQKPLVAAFARLDPQDSLCSIYETQEEQLAVAIPFIRIGLERGEKCIYIADAGSHDTACAALGAAGIDVKRSVASNALVLATKEQTYLKRGSFDPAWMFAFWKEAADAAISGGFSALRAIGETDWVLRHVPAIERWMEYERTAHRVSENKNNCFALCQYNRTLFPPEFILNIMRTHPVVVYRGRVCDNLHRLPPDGHPSGSRAHQRLPRRGDTRPSFLLLLST